MKLCGGGCGAKIADDARRCDACSAERRAGNDVIKIHSPFGDDGIKSHTLTDRERYHFLYHSRRWWEKVQPQVIRRHPFCARCQAAVSVIADHRVPAGIAIAQAQESGRWPFDKHAGFWLMSNLWGLCRDCHAKKTAEDKAHVGPWPNVVEEYDKAPKKVWRF